MNLEIGQTLSANELKKFEHLSTFGAYELYVLYEDFTFLVAIDAGNLICGCFEFHEREEGMILAHMYVLKHLQSQGIGKAIIAEAVSLWDCFELPSTNPDDTYYYIEDGLPFIRECFEKRILTEPPFKRPE